MKILVEFNWCKLFLKKIKCLASLRISIVLTNFQVNENDKKSVTRLHTIWKKHLHVSHRRRIILYHAFSFIFLIPIQCCNLFYDTHLYCKHKHTLFKNIILSKLKNTKIYFHLIYKCEFIVYYKVEKPSMKYSRICHLKFECDQDKVKH